MQAALAGLAELVTADQSMDEFLSAVVGWAAHAIPGADGAAITLVEPADGGHAVGFVAESADLVGEVHILQEVVHHEGPHFTCLTTQAAVVSGSLDTDRRWPNFGRGMVDALGVHSAASWPLLVGARMIGVLDAFAHARDAFDEHALQQGARFAGLAAVSTYNAGQLRRAHDVAKQLQHQLAQRKTTDQAVGIIRARTGASVEEALARLVRISQVAGVEPSVIAHRLIERSMRRSRTLRP